MTSEDYLLLSALNGGSELCGVSLLKLLTGLNLSDDLVYKDI